MARTAALLICLAALAAAAMAAPEHSFRQVALSEGRSLQKGGGDIIDKILDLVECAGRTANPLGDAIEQIVSNVRKVLSQVGSLKGGWIECKPRDIMCKLEVAQSGSEILTDVIGDLIESLKSAVNVGGEFKKCLKNPDGTTTPAPSN